MIIYYFIFYSIKLLLEKLGNKDFPMYGAVGIISMGEFFVLLILELNNVIVFFKGNSKIIGIGLYFVFYYLNYLVLIKHANHDKYKKIINSQSLSVKIAIFVISFLIVFAPFYIFVNTLQ
jgi:hypothetical protein